MRSRLLVCVFMVGCATAKPKPSADEARIYALPEEAVREQVTAALQKLGFHPEPTDDPHMLKAVKRSVVKYFPSGHKVESQGESFKLYETERHWYVLFQPLGPKATAVRVMTGEQLVWGNAAERTGLVHEIGAPEPRPALNPDLAVPLSRDRETEAAVAAELDARIGVDVSDIQHDPGFTPAEREPLADPAPPAAPLAAAAGCDLDVTPIESMLAGGHFVLLSDPTGANEPWQVVDRLLCAAAARGLPVTLALSMPGREQPSVNQYLSSDGGEGARRQLLGSLFWRRIWQDGRSSVAVAQALERVRTRRSHGAAVSVLAADTDLAGNDRHAQVASQLLSHRVAHPDRLIIAVLGNVLTTRHVGAAWDEGLLPVGARLAAVLPARTHAFDAAYWEGSQWRCMLEQQGKLRCGTWAIVPGPAQRTAALTPRPYFRVFDSTSEYGFDGVYFVGGALTASPPALESMRVDEGNPVVHSPRGRTGAGADAPAGMDKF